ncbi:Hypothetical protein DEACI_1173 [Acididesulfobacillus acetoxydans]|uniref:Uncharacterized protein n=1 Tax=Acididesulfobacillus acetoxydans TaxID=1561005 RepID=A0A8S0X426_9FIRM|nr:Hypothetical protein DEACI_1173 [Acididesulfobacillus acetoxydans]CEJ06654.1 Hypothetical protein DEACI_1103 [Acididesulfobacillus acetoxydans]
MFGGTAGHYPNISPAGAPPHVGPITSGFCPLVVPVAGGVGVGVGAGIIAIAILILIRFRHPQPQTPYPPYSFLACVRPTAGMPLVAK